MKKYKWWLSLFLLILTLKISLFLPVNHMEKEYIPITITEPEIPQIMQDIAFCESRNRQFNKDGSVYMGEINPLDTGKFQINQKYWLKKSQELGYDIFTLKGNTDMALWIYKHYGTTPWNWSRDLCWGKRL